MYLHVRLENLLYKIYLLLKNKMQINIFCLMATKFICSIFKCSQSRCDGVINSAGGSKFFLLQVSFWQGNKVQAC